MSNYSPEEFEAIQAVVDRVSAYQDGAPEETVETELKRALDEAGVDLENTEITAIAEAIDAHDGDVSASDVLG